LCGKISAQSQVSDIDTELSNLADKLAIQIKDQGKKKVAVIDFTDLQGGTGGELGKYVAEQLTVDLVMDRKDFSVLDRANLKKILDEHKLTATGLVDPDNAKKLGQFAGVDAIILGTIVPKSQTVGVTAKIIMTDTAEIVGATKAEFRLDNNVQQLIEKPVAAPSPENGGAADTEPPKPEKPPVIKILGDLSVEVQPLRIVAGRQYNLTLTLSNRSRNKSMWIAVSMDRNNNAVNGSIINSESSSFGCTWQGISGISYDRQYDGYFTKATEIKPGSSITAVVKFISFNSRPALSGSCQLQLEFLEGDDYWNGSGHCTAQNLVTKIETQ
jgi:TolB-like protein